MPKSFSPLDAGALASSALLIAFLFAFALPWSAANKADGVRLPVSSQLHPTIPSENISIVLEVLSDGGVALDNAVYTKVELETALLQQRKMLEKHGRDVFAKATIILRADRSAKFGDVRDVIQLCEKTGFKHFSLRADCTPTDRER